MKIAIIGAGPAGLAAAKIISKKIQVVVFEKNSDAGKKLLLTGSGRCNIGNTNNDLSKYHSSNNEFIEKIINDKNLDKVNNFFKEIGLVLKDKNGYLYPYSEKSSSVLSCLKNSLDVDFRFNTNIENIERKNDKFIINHEIFDKVIITTGGLSYPKTGSSGEGFHLAKAFGHKVTNLNPSLMALETNSGLEKEWAGIRCEVNVSSYIDKAKVKEEHGELQFTSFGLSGICIFNLSRDIRLALNEGKKCEVKLNLCPWTAHLSNYMEENKDKYLTNICDGFLDYKLTNIILKYLKIKDKKWCELKIDEKNKFIETLTNFKVKIIDTKGYLDAQVTSGGVSLEEINLETMESKLVKNLYFAGEVLDLDGDCGGYNLTISFITGLVAGDNHD